MSFFGFCGVTLLFVGYLLERQRTVRQFKQQLLAKCRKLRPTDSIYRVGPDIFALALPGTDSLDANRIAVRLQEELQEVRAKYTKVFDFDVTPHHYPQDVQSAHELEDIVKSLLPEQQEGKAPIPAMK